MRKPLKIVIVGNGFGGLYTLKNLHHIFCGNDNVHFTLVGDKNYFLFTPLLHEVATGSINPSNIIEPIRKVLGCCVNEFYLGKAQKVNLREKSVEVDNHSISYDYLVLAPGSVTNFYGIKGAEENSFTLKSVEDAIKIKNHCLRQIEKASHVEDEEVRKNMLRFVVVGGGPTGVELAAELEELIKRTFPFYYDPNVVKDASVVLIQKAPALIPQFSKNMQVKALAVLKKKGVEIMLGTGVSEVTPLSVTLDNNTEIPTENVFWVGGIKPASIDFDENISRSPDGKIIVNEYFELEKHKEVFAIGDAALTTQNGAPVPALAQAAEKEAAALAHNLKLIINGQVPRKFKWKNQGTLLSIGRWMALAEIFGFNFSGAFAWWVWRTVYLFKMISFRKKVRVAIDWTMNIFSPRDISEL